MLVATFNATTGWSGRQITWRDERFILDGHGVITTADVLEYDREGHLDWPSEEMRSWAAARRAWEQEVAAPPAAAEPVVAPTAAGIALAEPVVTPVAAQPVTASAAGEPATPPAGEVRDVLAPGGDIVEVVGSSPYQEALEAIAGAEPGAVGDVEKWAYLVPEPDNPWDRKAVAVYIDGRKVGYLPRESPAAYADLLGRLWTASRGRAVCRAVVSDGWQRVQSQVGSVSSFEQGQFGVRLALAAPQRFDVTTSLRELSSEELEAGPPPV